MSKQFAAMNMAMLSVIDSFEQLESVSSNAIDVTSLRHAHSELQNLESAFNQVEQEIRQSENAQEKLNHAISSSDDAARSLLGTIGAIAGTYLSLQGIGEAIRISDQMTDTIARVQLLVDDMPVFDDQSVNVDVKSSGIDEVQHDIDNLNTLLTLNTNWNNFGIQQDLSALDNSLINVDVQTDGKQLAELSSNLAQIRTNEADVLLSVENTQSLDDIQGKVNSLQANSINVDVAVTGMSQIEQAQQLIFESAQRSYSSFKDTADMVSRIGSNARDSFSSISEVIAFTELIQKQFGIAGANAVEASNATIQLTQALASGVLRGDELASIFEQAPNLVQTIADYLDVPIGSIRDMASEGQLTADIVKNAMFSAADDINNRFNSMPTTWSQIWTNMKNDALWAFRDVLSYINGMANSDTTKSFLQDMKGQLYLLAEYAMQALEMMSSIGSFIYENWSLIAPIVGTATAALVAYGIALGVMKLAQIASTVWTGLMILATGLYTATSWASVQATLAATGAVWGLNAALYSNPIFWVVLAVIALIGVLYLAVAVINYFAGTSISATGIIAGAFMALGAYIYNVIVFMWNIFAAIAEFFINVWQHPVYSVKALFVNLANVALDMAESMIGSFDSAATNLANMFIDGANMAISAINWIIDALNEIPGVDIGKIGEISHRTSVSADYSGLRNKMNDWLGETPSDYWEAPKMDLKSIPDSFMTGYDWGADLFNADKLKEDNQLTNGFEELMGLSGIDPDSFAANAGDNGLEDAINKGNGAADKIANNTGKLADSVTLLEEDLEYLRDAAERESINRYTTAEIKVDMKNENHINNEMDIDGIIDRFGEKMEEAVNNVAEGNGVDV